MGSGGSGWGCGWKPEMNTGTQSLSTVPGGLWPLGEISLPGKFLFFCSDSWPCPGQPQGDAGILNQEPGAKMEELSQPRAEGGLGGPHSQPPWGRGHAPSWATLPPQGDSWPHSRPVGDMGLRHPSCPGHQVKQMRSGYKPRQECCGWRQRPRGL